MNENERRKETESVEDGTESYGPRKLLTTGRETKPKSIRIIIFLIVVGTICLILVALQVYDSDSLKSADVNEQLDMSMNMAKHLEGSSERFIDQITPEPTPEPTLEPTPMPTPVPLPTQAPPAKKRSKKIDPMEKMLREKMLEAMGAGTSMQGTWPGVENQAGDEKDKRIAELEAQLQAQQGGGQPGMAGGGDQNNQAGKIAFLANAQQEKNPGLHKYTREPLVTPLAVQAGTIIPCVLLSRIISDLPGECLGQVAENVYDSPTGKHLLIPQGAKVIGAYDSQISFGQKRLLVVWKRIIYPDGSSLFLQGMQGVDASGTAGMKGEVDNHIWQMLQAAVMTSLFVAGQAAVMPEENGDTTVVVNPDSKSTTQIFKESVAEKIADMGSKYFEKVLEKQPTLTLNAGLRFNVFVPRDVIFPSEWEGR